MKRQRKNKRKQTTQFRFESLEPRQLMAGDLSGNGNWNIGGTMKADEIYIARDSAEPNLLLAEVNGKIIDAQYESDVKSIRVRGYAGNDHIEIDQSAGEIKTRTWFSGDHGNDVIIGGSGNDVILGSHGNDELIGNGGRDYIVGNNGDDYLEGTRAHRDVLKGGRGNNELVWTDDIQSDELTNRVPAEWEKHDSTWMQWPKGQESSYRENFAGIIGILADYEQINIAVESGSARTQATQFLQQRGVAMNNVNFHIMPYDWSWMRDNGAIWVEKTDAEGGKSMGVQDWGFNGWGGDGGPSRKDDAVPTHVAKIENVAYEKVNVTLEKGTLEFNGKDTVIASWTVLSDRNPGMSKAQLEIVFSDKFGVSKTVWISGKSDGDLTDGHVDGIARFVNETTVVVARHADHSDPDAALYENAARSIRNAGFNVVRLDIPGYVQYRGEWLPANYTNYLVANDVVIASSYGNARFDDAAKAQLQKLFPNRDIQMTDTRELWYNGGAVHCVTNDQPLLQANRSNSQPARALVPVNTQKLDLAFSDYK